MAKKDDSFQNESFMVSERLENRSPTEIAEVNRNVQKIDND